MEIGTGGLNGNRHGLGVRRDCMDVQTILSHLKVHRRIYYSRRFFKSRHIWKNQIYLPSNREDKTLLYLSYHQEKPSMLGMVYFYWVKYLKKSNTKLIISQAISELLVILLETDNMALLLKITPIYLIEHKKVSCCLTGASILID